MKNVFLGIVIAAAIFFSWHSFYQRTTQPVVEIHSSGLLQEQLKHVGKLVVTEGYFSDVLNYKHSKPLFTNMFSADKKALIVVNAKVTLAYDLSQLEYIIDEDSKTLHIKKIPKEDITIHPELKYYDIQSDFFNPFEAKDHNEINTMVTASLMKKIEASHFKKNSKDRLLNELSKLYIVTRSMGWRLRYKDAIIESTAELATIND